MYIRGLGKKIDAYLKKTRSTQRLFAQSLATHSVTVMRWRYTNRITRAYYSMLVARGVLNGEKKKTD